MTDGPVSAGAHLWWSELACHDRVTTPYPGMWRDDRLPPLVEAFEAIRAECCAELGSDCPLFVVSGYRTPSYQASLLDNPALKAALHSQHCEGRALDLKASRLDFERFKWCVYRAAHQDGSPIRYVEFRPSMGYIHVDVRDVAELVMETVT